jgi:adenylate cyclase
VTEERAKRKLTAIFSADVKGYSRLMADDEEATVRTINAYREVMIGLINGHAGRVVDAKGDNVLAAFPSVVDAVRCAVQVQKELKERNSGLPEHRRMEFRIGVNLGDVIEDEGTLYGDGVNVAARLEGLAEGGGICISGTAFDHVKNRISVGYEYRGKQAVKNIPDPVRVYKVLVEPEAAGKVFGEEKRRPIKGRRVAVAAAALIAVAAIGLIWNFYLRQDVDPASKEKMAFPLPEKPSIAVLPFTNMSDDPNQEYFSDGLAEEIITALSKVPQLFVIARNSTFSYKGKFVKVNQIAEELGVRYVLEGSVRKEGDRVRITAQLIDALTGHHLWAERYDRDLRDVFALQDEITMKVLTALQVKLTDGEVARISAKGTQKLEAYLKVMQARVPFYTITKEGFAQARRLCEEALAIDPDYAAAYVYLGSTHFMDVVLGSSKSPKESMKLAFECLTKATSLDDSYAAAHSILGFLYVMKKQYDRGIAESKRAISLEPNSATGYIWMSLVLTRSGNHQEAVQPAEHALRLDPLGPPWWFRELGQAYSWVGRYEAAIAAFKKSLQKAPNDISTHIALTNAYSWAGRLEDARAQAREVLRINPKYSLEQDARASQYKNQADRDRYLDGLRKAGLPDKPPLPLPDKPSIAVLPFVNMSYDKSQESFSDGLTEEIITALSKTPKLFVIARNSSFVYKGRSVNVQQISRELGVRYVLEGSVRRSGDQLRITAQLIDAATGNHLWAERYDREMKDVFAIQDEVTMKILTSLQVKLTEGEEAHMWARGTKDLSAYLKLVAARENMLQFNKETNVLASQLAKEALDLDPQYASAYMILSKTHIMDILLGTSSSPKQSMMQAMHLAQQAIAIDESLGAARGLLGFLYTMTGQFEKGIEEAEKAVSLEPNSDMAFQYLGLALRWGGRPNEAILVMKKAIRLNPFAPGNYLFNLGLSYLFAGQYKEAISECRKATASEPDNLGAQLALTVAYGLSGRDEEARATASEVLRIDPKFSLEGFSKTLVYKNQVDRDRFIGALRKAGLK